MEKTSELSRSELAHEVIGKFIKTDRIHRQVVENIMTGNCKIHRTQHHFLMYLAHSETAPSQKELAEHFNVSPASVAVTLKKLEAEGYINRESTEEDSRRNMITITPKGLDIVERSRTLFRMIDDCTIKDITDEELDALIRILEKMCNNLQTLNEKGCQ